MPSRPCAVTLVDTRGIRHSAEVNAASVFEAAVLALQAFKTSGWVEEVGPGTRLEVQVCAPVTRHTVTVAQLRRWTEGAAVSRVMKKAPCMKNAG